MRTKQQKVGLSLYEEFESTPVFFLFIRQSIILEKSDTSAASRTSHTMEEIVMYSTTATNSCHTNELSLLVLNFMYNQFCRW